MNELITQEKNITPLSDIERMGNAFAKSGLFGVKTPEQAIALMLVAQAEGRHPATIAMEYDIIAGRPALKSQTALIRFQNAGGKIKWINRTDEKVSAEFSHPACESLIVTWDIKRAEKMGYMIKDNWKKQPMIMLQWRVVAEGVRACYPACLGGAYLDSEVIDFDIKPQPEKTINTQELKDKKIILESKAQTPINASKELPKEIDGRTHTIQQIAIKFEKCAKDTPLPKENYKDACLNFCASVNDLKDVISSEFFTQEQLSKAHRILTCETRKADNFISQYLDGMQAVNEADGQGESNHGA